MESTHKNLACRANADRDKLNWVSLFLFGKMKNKLYI